MLLLWTFSASGLSEFLDLSSERLHWAAPPGAGTEVVSIGAAANGTDQREGTAAGQSDIAGGADTSAAAADMGAPGADAPKEPPPNEVLTASFHKCLCSA